MRRTSPVAIGSLHSTEHSCRTTASLLASFLPSSANSELATEKASEQASDRRPPSPVPRLLSTKKRDRARNYFAAAGSNPRPVAFLTTMQHNLSKPTSGLLPTAICLSRRRGAVSQPAARNSSGGGGNNSNASSKSNSYNRSRKSRNSDNSLAARSKFALKIYASFT